MNTQLDHLVVMAPSLDAGVQWCERTLGVTPGPGGEHPLMGTHNRLLKIAAPAWEDAYLEIIALNPAATPQRPAPLKRWFDFDDAALAQRIAAQGPQLVHWVARTADVDAAVGAWRALGIERGDALAASRMTPHGLLEWRITVRDDGQRLFDGCLPTLIQWGSEHPARRMADSTLKLRSLRLQHPQAGPLSRALASAGVDRDRVEVAEGPAGIHAVLHTPRGPVTI